ncbi:hypothetical protein KIW84_050140 [Lathyrus oleraceus]|uniref:Reverse transcriptase n=1 Tax=Pisum sativum TaxID=3888 RepID=A0A9D5AC04_PEA|nr:hypothetical protein KIW84_050140 [Pisum sativum]
MGFIVSEKGIEVDPDKVKAIQEIPEPRTEKQVCGFLGRLNYIARVKLIKSVMRMRPHALNPGQGELMTKKAWGSRKWDPFPLDRLWTKIWGTCSEASAHSASIKNDTLNNGGLATNPFYPSIASSLGGLNK